jgi:flavin reductase (DIM6/NTAB) family NADH-FMN oxidoreductase RutF
VTLPTQPYIAQTPYQPLAPDFSTREFRDALGSFATGVTIITARDADGALVGLTANSFNSVSLSPPLVLWSLSRTGSSMPVMSSTMHYAINILGADQQALAERFATKSIDRWAGVTHTPGIHNTPLLTGSIATFECFNRSQYTEGDHVIFVGEVERCSYPKPGAKPLLYHGGRFYADLPR